MAPNPGSERILGVLDSVSRDLGAGAIVAQPPIERGAGDIAFVCGDGRLACLDGLGTDGENDHAPGEYVLLELAAAAGKARGGTDASIDPIDRYARAKLPAAARAPISFVHA